MQASRSTGDLIKANNKIKYEFLAESADPDLLTGPFETCPFSTPEGAVRYIRANLKEIRGITDRIAPKNKPNPNPAKWYEWVTLCRLLRCTTRACAAYERLVSTMFMCDIKELPRRKRNGTLSEGIEWCIQRLGDEADPGEIAVNEVMLYLYRIFWSVCHDARYYKARMRLLQYEEEKEYTDAMKNAGWHEDDFIAIKERDVRRYSDW